MIHLPTGKQLRPGKPFRSQSGRPIVAPVDGGSAQWRFNKFILCFNSLFVAKVSHLVIYCILGQRTQGYDIIVGYTELLLYAVMIGLGFLELWHARYNCEILKRKNVAFAIGTYSTICLIMAVQSPISLTTNTRFGFVNSVFTWLLPVVAVFGVRVGNWDTIRKTVCWQSAIGCISLLCAVPLVRDDIAQINIATQRLNIAEASGGALLAGAQVLYGGTFLLLSFRSLPMVWRVTALTSAGLIMWIGLLGKFRSVVFVVLATVVLALFYIPLRIGATSLGKWRSKSTAPVVVGLVVLFAICFAFSLTDKLNPVYEVVTQYVEAVVGRGVTISDEGFQSGVDIRVEESVEAIGELNLLQLFIGKGFGATWSGGSHYDEQRDMLHLGMAHLVLNGGILLALFFLLGPALMATRVFLVSRAQIPLVCAGVVCLTLLGTFISNIFFPSLSYLMVSLCMGGSLLHLERKETRLDAKG